MRHASRLALAIIAGSLLVAGCSYPPVVAVRLPEQPLAAPADVEHKDGTFEGVHGTQLYAQSWRPKGEARAAVIIVHGLMDHSTRYKTLAERLAKEGFAVHAFDLRGHGRSEGMRVWVDAFGDYIGDLDLFMNRVKEQEKGKPVLLFGHSMGGAISALYAANNKPQLAGLVLSAGAFATDVGSGGAKFVNALAPSAGVFQPDVKLFSRDQAVVTECLNDPLVYQGKAPARTAAQLLGAIADVQEREAEITVPVLALHGDADKVTPLAGSKQLVERAQSKDKTLKTYAGAFHDLVHEPEKDQIIGDIVKWMSDHAPAGGAPAAAPPAAPPAPVKPPEGQKTQM